jgi:hypothetical protein
MAYEMIFHIARIGGAARQAFRRGADETPSAGSSLMIDLANNTTTMARLPRDRETERPGVPGL